MSGFTVPAPSFSTALKPLPGCFLYGWLSLMIVVMRRLKSKNILLMLSCLIGLSLFLMLTDPQHLSLLWLVVPFALWFGAFYWFWRMILKIFKRRADQQKRAKLL